MLSPDIARRAPKPYIGLCAEDAAGLNLAEGEDTEINAGTRRFTLPCRLLPGVPAGIAGMPRGLPGMPRIDLPCTITVRKCGGRP